MPASNQEEDKNMSLKKIVSKSIALVLVGISVITPMTNSVLAMESKNQIIDSEEEFNLEEFEDIEPIEIEIDLKDVLLNVDEYKNEYELNQAVEEEVKNQVNQQVKYNNLARAYIGEKKTITIKFTNESVDLMYAAINVAGAMFGGGIINALKISSPKLVKNAGKFWTLAGTGTTLNRATNYKGYQYKVYMTYKSTTIFDGQHVTYSGWHVTGYGAPTRYK